MSKPDLELLAAMQRQLDDLRSTTATLLRSLDLRLVAAAPEHTEQIRRTRRAVQAVGLVVSLIDRLPGLPEIPANDHGEAVQSGGIDG